MLNLRAIEIKAFVPAQDFALSKEFYQDIGFTLASEWEDAAYFYYGSLSFLLQDFDDKNFACNFMMHLLVENVNDWWQHIQAQQISEKYNITIYPPSYKPWKMKEFVIVDPSGVCWHIAENIFEGEK